MRTAVGDPYYGVESLEYSGRVSIYTGQLEGSTYSLTLHLVLGREHTVHFTENPIYVFPGTELRSLSPNSCIHVSVSNLYIFPGSAHIFGCSKTHRPILEIYKSDTDIIV
jgi:hypothetical protein